MSGKSNVTRGPLIKEGGFGTVYQGTWKGIDAAIKILKTSSKEKDKTDIKNIAIKEVEIHRGLRYEHIISFYAVEEVEGFPAIITEYAERGSLASVLEDKKIELDWNTRWRFAKEITLGVNFLHIQNI